jgi:hypothetical protein
MARRPKTPPPEQAPLDEEVFELVDEQLVTFLSTHPTDEDREEQLRPDNQELLNLVRGVAHRFRNSRQQASQQEAAVVSAVRGARALGVRAKVFRQVLALEDMTQRDRDRWFIEFEVMCRALEIPVQGQLFGATEEG